MRHIELGIVTGVVNLLNVDASKTKETHFCIALRCEWPFWFFRLRPVIGKTEQPRAGKLSPAGLHDNNKDQFDFGSKMQK